MKTKLTLSIIIFLVSLLPFGAFLVNLRTCRNYCRQSYSLQNFKLTSTLKPSILLVKQLRDETNAPMMDCQRAIAESNGNMELARGWLHRRGLEISEKKSTRVTSAGLVGFALDSTKQHAVIVELNCETDFVAKNEVFQSVLDKILAIASRDSTCTEQSILQLSLSPQADNDIEKNGTVKDLLCNGVSSIGENIHIKRVLHFSTIDDEYIFSYVHHPVNDRMGKIVAMVSLQLSANLSDVQDRQKVINFSVLEELGRELSMHIVAMKPSSIHNNASSSSSGSSSGMSTNSSSSTDRYSTCLQLLSALCLLPYCCVQLHY